MKSNQLPLTLKMLVIVGLTAALGYQPTDSRASQDDPCELCESQFYFCGGWQNDYCVNQYARCLYRNGCPPIEFIHGGALPGTESFVPVAGY